MRALTFGPNYQLSLGATSCHGFVARLFGWRPSKITPARETAWLDGLRGVAAFLVMSYHFNLHWWGYHLEGPYGGLGPYGNKWHIWRLPFIRIVMCAGHAQVSIFFVLSGFVLSWNPLSTVRSGNGDKLAQSLGSAITRRWLRLYLPCFAIIFGECLEYWNGLGGDFNGEPEPNLLMQIWHFVKATERWSNPFKLDRGPWTSIHDYDHTVWTIPYEFSGSMLVFVLLVAVGRIPRYAKRTLAVIVITLYAFFMAQWTYGLFLTGVLLADYVQLSGGFENVSALSTLPRIIWSIVLVIALYLAGVPEKNDNYFTRPGYTFLDALVPANWEEAEGGQRFWWCWAGVLVILASCHLATIRKIFELSFPRYLGRVSFMLYITHRIVLREIGIPVRYAMLKVCGEKQHSLFEQKDVYVASSWLTFIIYFAHWAVIGPLALLIAHWCEVLIDSPSTRLARRVDDFFTKDIVQNDHEAEGLLHVAT